MDNFFLKSTLAIGIPFYNAEGYLAQAIDSVLCQTFPDFELILIDDGSNDSSLQIAKKYANKDSRIKVYSDGKNKNLATRLNEISSLTQAVYLARMDADDIMHPNRIKKQFEFLKKHPEIDVLGTNAYSINENNMVFGIRSKVENHKIVKVNQFIHPTIMAKRSWFLENKYDVKAIRIEDAELWYRTQEKYNFYSLTEPLLFYREFGENYYKKYFGANISKKYILEKYERADFWVKFFIKNRILGIIYKLFNIIGRENILLKCRNEIRFTNERSYEEFIDLDVNNE